MYPIEQCNDKVGVFLLNKGENEKWIKSDKQKTSIIRDDMELSKHFDSFCKKQERQYRSYLEPNTSKYILAAKNRGWIKRCINGKKALLYKNIIRAEAHRDVLLNLLSK